ncbi:NADH-ubiquinone oxidoreductase complex I, 21 kDa subunit-domain-containing protein [Podospora appendiculata]|uniref:NADH-ubiquinone oxidoreductase complex I, 21 kDa subunit-domain-containing protein n=1 Tax=Podospora appendiculata TaxID=314037 RepID=A0AAE0XLK1_9PEZI|nr:NADH-ubiquinone oxidoreductase complex I, 21 kDa subunit-domain-containing protein [Podospora appendiculata]
MLDELQHATLDLACSQSRLRDPLDGIVLSAATMSNTTTTQTSQTYQFPSKTVVTDWPLIDNDPHFKRVVGYARPSDYVHGAVATAFGPGLLYTMERFAPSYVGKGGFAQAMRLTGFIGACGGFFYFYQRSILRFYGMSENAREVQMDMREMVDKVKAGKPLYGESQLTPAMQGVAARQSRYSALFMGVLPWFNFVNHSQHGVDTAKYYQQAERELEAERLSKSS